MTSFIKNHSCSPAGSADISGRVTPICVTSTLTFKPSFLSPQAWSGCPWQTWTARPERTTALSSRPRTWAASWGGSLAPPPSTSRSLISTTTRLCSTRVRDGLTLPPRSSVSHLSHSIVHTSHPETTLVFRILPNTHTAQKMFTEQRKCSSAYCNTASWRGTSGNLIKYQTSRCLQK